MSELMRKAMYYKELDRKALRCELCPQYCVILPGEQGKCRGRENIDGILYCTNYALSVGLSRDPIEKKPLYHFRPGSTIVSLGPNSCNLACRFCQNYTISQSKSSTLPVSVDDLYRLICENSALKQVAFTYTEPLTWYEYILDFGRAHPDIDIILISNGFINEEPLAELLPHVKAMNIDLKSSRDDFYIQQCEGKLQPVLKSITMAHHAGVHLEITLLLIPGLNDASGDIIKLRDLIGNLDANIPLHISAYHPDYLMSTPPTSIDDVAQAITIAKEKLHYVYGGNLPVEDFMQTKCPSCSRILIRREFGAIPLSFIDNGKCPACACDIYGIFD